MKDSVKIFAVLALLSLPSLMKSQIINPFPIENRDQNCPVEVTINEYDVACNLLGSNVMYVPTSTTNFWSLNAATADVEIIVNWAVSPACSSGVTVITSCGSSCTGVSSGTLSFSCCASLTNVLVSCAAGALIN